MRGWLKDARTKMGLTMAQIAEKLCISESYYCAIEGGYRQRRMDISLVIKLSEILGMSVGEIWAFEEKTRKDKKEVS